MAVVFLCDFFLEDILGGGEICNEVVIQKLSKDRIVIKKKCSQCTVEFLDSHVYDLIVVGNFSMLSEDCKNFMMKYSRYVIYEHDYKFVRNRNPAAYHEFLVPKDQLVNISFFKAAEEVICQSTFQKNIFMMNFDRLIVSSLGTNFWFDEHYDLMLQLSAKEKLNKYCILNSGIDHKNTKGAIEFCKKNGFSFDLIEDRNYESFLKKLGSYSHFVFMPKTPETFSRTCAEARMMNVNVITNELVGFQGETWQKGLKGEKLITVMKVRNEAALEYFERLA